MTIAPLAMALVLPLAVFGLFESAWTAAGVAGAAVSIPIVIHLLNRRRFKVVSWAAMRFLLAAQRKNSRRLQLEQLLLLATRCLMVLLVVLAMTSISAWAEKIWHSIYSTQALQRGPRTYKLIVLDGSFSMGVRDGNQTLFEKARTEAATLVRNSASGDAFGVVLMTWPGRGTIVSRPSEDRERVAAEIEKLRLPHGNADLATTLETVTNSLKGTPPKFPHREVYIYTDLQGTTWRAGGKSENIKKAAATFKDLNARTILVDVGREEPTANLAVTGLRLDGDQVRVGSATSFTATLHNFGTPSASSVIVRWLVGKAPTAGTPGFEPIEVARDTRNLEPGRNVPVSFVRVFDEPGEYVVQVRLDKSDNGVLVPVDLLSIDDVRSIVVRAGPRVPVLVVEGKSTGDEALRPSWALQRALRARARVTVVGIDDFADEGRGDLSAYDCVFLCDVPQLTHNMVKRLTTHVRRGGGLVICLGDNVDSTAYNEELFRKDKEELLRKGAGLLPVPLKTQQTGTVRYHFELPQDLSTRGKPPLHQFVTNDEQESLTEPHFRRFWHVGEPGPAGKPREVLSFRGVPVQRGEGDTTATVAAEEPAILEWQPPLNPERALSNPDVHEVERRMPGRVVLITTKVGFDPDRDGDSNWPNSDCYPILMNDLMFYAASARLQEQSSDAGDRFELLLPGPGGDGEADVFLPNTSKAQDKKLRCLDLGDVGVYLVYTTESGIYRLQIPGEPRQRLFAVNPPGLNSAQLPESDLTRLKDEELLTSLPEWDLQIVRDANQADHLPKAPPPGKEGSAETESNLEPLGPDIARWLLLSVLFLSFVEVALAWGLGRHSSVPQPDMGPARPVRPWKDWAFYQRWLVRLLPPTLWLALVGIAAILIHERITGDFLGFLSDNSRQWLERRLGVPEPPPGEGRRWRLDYHESLVKPFVLSWLNVHIRVENVWLVPLFGVCAGIFVGFAYFREGFRNSIGARIRLIGLRIGFLALFLCVLLPRVDWLVERQGFPDVVLLLDDSESMATQDIYADKNVREMAERLAAVLPPETDDPKIPSDPNRPGGSEVYALPRGARLRLAAALLSRPNPDWLANLLLEHKVRLHIWRCSALATPLTETVANPGDLNGARADLRKLLKEPGPRGDSSQLGKAVRQVLNEFRGTSLAAIIMLTDGVTTEDEDLEHVASYAKEVNIPLYFVGIGDAHDVLDVYLHNLKCEDSVFVNDNLIFEVSLTAQGYKNLNTFVRLHEKNSQEILDKTQVTTDAVGNPVKVTLQHRPQKPGPKVYVLDTDVQPGEVDVDNNKIEKAVFVHESRSIRVLYVEGYRRYEYHYLKTLLERESDRLKNNKSIDLKVLLLDGGDHFQVQDRSAVGRIKGKAPVGGNRNPDWDPYAFPTRAKLAEYDVVILGDLDPDNFGQNPRLTKENLKDLADFVVNGGGGLLVLSGERGTPSLLKSVPQMADVLPVELLTDRPPPDRDRPEGYRFDLTGLGREHPIFRFSPDKRENEEVLRRLREMYWYAEGYRAKRTAEVLANHPSAMVEGNERQPLVLQQFSGLGRCLFFGFNETWRWGFREDQALYNQFWIKTIRYLSRSRLGRIDLRLEPQSTNRKKAYQATGYCRGDPIKVTVRFPDDVPAPDANTRVEVRLTRRSPDGDTTERALTLLPQVNSPTTFETVLTQTPVGAYRFQLVAPSLNPPPRAECKVSPPPDETFCPRLNQTELENAARESGGKFYNLADADNLLKELQVAPPDNLYAACPPWPLWNQILIFLVVIGLLSAEWLLRKDMNLL